MSKQNILSSDIKIDDKNTLKVSATYRSHELDKKGFIKNLHRDKR